MNPFGALIIVLGVLLIITGIKGTHKNLSKAVKGL